jgi:4-hydroxy-tetrahydrodipicolinate synthase
MTHDGLRVVGVCPVLSAVFHDDGSVDYEGFAQLCRHVVDTGISSLMVFGIATENAKLNDEERSLMLATLLRERAGSNVLIVATVADHATELATDRAKRWVDMGADLINVLPSYFLNPEHAEVVNHLDSILHSVEVPVIIQSLPLGGKELPLRDMVALHQEHSHLVQIKVEDVPASPSVRDVIAFSGGRVSALVGWGGLEWKEATEAGAVGVQPGCSLTELYLRAQTFLTNSDEAGFANAFSLLRPALEAWMRHPEVLIAIEKHILQERGIIRSSRTRHPSATLSSGDYALAEPLLALVKERATPHG